MTECKRFLSACTPESLETNIQKYLDWRQQHALDEDLVASEGSSTSSNSDDNQQKKTTSTNLHDEFVNRWAECVHKVVLSTHGTTISIHKSEQQSISQHTSITASDDFGHSSSSDEEGDYAAPPSTMTLTAAAASYKQMAFLPYHTETNEPLRDVDGHQCVLVVPGRINLKANTDGYAQICALLADATVDRHVDERFTLLVDCRAGPNWPNPSALSLLSFIRHVAHAVFDLNPARCHKVILYPVPRAAVYLWKIIAPLIDPSLRDLMVLMHGPDSLSAETLTPTKLFGQHIPLNHFHLLNEVRDRVVHMPY